MAPVPCAEVRKAVREPHPSEDGEPGGDPHHLRRRGGAGAGADHLLLRSISGAARNISVYLQPRPLLFLPFT